MKAQMNLLHDEFIPKFEWVCGSHFIGIILFSILLSAAGFGFVHYLVLEEEKGLALIQQQLKTEQRSVEELTTALVTRTKDPILQSKITQLSTQTRVQMELLDKIKNLSDLKQRSFSSMFDSLAQSHNTQLWLTNFEVTTKQMNIEGELLQPKALPVWISQLSKTPYFKGQEFDVASVFRDEEQLFFLLKSQTKSEQNTLARRGVENAN